MSTEYTVSVLHSLIAALRANNPHAVDDIRTTALAVIGYNAYKRIHYQAYNIVNTERYTISENSPKVNTDCVDSVLSTEITPGHNED